METEGTKRALIMCNMSYKSDWDAGIVNRNYHVLQELIARNEYDIVVSVDYLPFSPKKRAKVMVQMKPWKKNAHTVKKSLTARIDTDAEREGVYHVTATTAAGVRKMLEAIDLPEDVTLWSYTPFAAEWYKEIPHTQFVFDAVDNWIEHSAYTNHKERLEKCYQEIRSAADTIFTVSEALVELFGKQDNAYFIPNGVDVDHYQGRSCPLHSEFEATIGYHGHIQSRVNISVFEYLAEKFPKYEFLIIGPVWKEMESKTKKLEQMPNVRMLGGMSYTVYPDYIACADVAIVPHVVNALTQSMNPLKIYEYLAAGLPVISSAVAGADKFQDLIKLAVSPEDFAEKIQAALKNDTEELRTRRINMARQHSWEKRLDVMLNIIQ